MELPDELKPDLHRTLLGPLSLANEIFGGLLPGCILTMLLAVKSRWIQSLFSYGLLGYKTKVACALVVSYVFGKASLSVVTLADELVRSAHKQRTIADAAKKSGDSKSTPLQVLSKIIADSPRAKSFVLGLFGGSFLLGKSGAYEYYAAYNADTLFHLSAGLTLTIAALIPGDGRLRYLEAILGVVLLARGLRSAWRRTDEFAGLFGMMVGSNLAKMTPEDLQKSLNAATSLVKQLAQPSPDAKPDEGKQDGAKLATS
jgi:hypothetical protein